MEGLIHIYCGKGKGKTTASVGLAVRAAGAGKKVLFVQFFKSGVSSEMESLRKLPNIETFYCETPVNFFLKMDDKQKQEAKELYTPHLLKALEKASDVDVLVLDEIISTCTYEVVDEAVLLDFLRNKRPELEVVMTGRDPSEQLQELADYITEMKKIRHPYDKKIMARKGIEF